MYIYVHHFFFLLLLFTLTLRRRQEVCTRTLDIIMYAYHTAYGFAGRDVGRAGPRLVSEWVFLTPTPVHARDSCGEPLMLIRGYKFRQTAHTPNCQSSDSLSPPSGLFISISIVRPNIIQYWYPSGDPLAFGHKTTHHRFRGTRRRRRHVTSRRIFVYRLKYRLSITVFRWCMYIIYIILYSYDKLQ